ncbi:MAG: DUF418 domain-containing protein [Planctomycetaceae bacterium]|nr:DUF418 domain-containing protein [Planctomycetaceae bacterium]
MAGIEKLETARWSFEYSFFFVLSLTIGEVCLSASHTSASLCRNGWLRWLQNSLVAVGQMALTNYLLQTIACTTLFYGHGFGWYG